MRTPFAHLDVRTLTRLGMTLLLLFFFSNFILRRSLDASWESTLDGASGVVLGQRSPSFCWRRATGRIRRGKEAGRCG
jgi:hypothetical protein